MIVKMKKKNIRRALSWGKDIMCEQIVVDTGSSDRTVEIAREMGAKIFFSHGSMILLLPKFCH